MEEKTKPEQDLWGDIYDSKVKRLGAIRDNFLGQNESKRGEVLSRLELLINYISDHTPRLPYEAQFVGPVAKSYRTSQEYFNEVSDQQTIEGIKEILENPDLSQLNKIFGSISKKQIALALGIKANSIRPLVQHLREGTASGYLCAKIAHWALNNGYNVRGQTET